MSVCKRDSERTSLQNFSSVGKMQDIVGILLLFMGAASGLLVQDPVVCRFTESHNQCSVALGQQLHLQMPLEDGFNLQSTDKTNNTRIIIKYRNNQSNPPTPNITGWQFVNDNKTLILTSAERNDSGTYTLYTFDVNGTSKGIYTLQLNIEGDTAHTLRILGLFFVLLVVIAVIGYFMYRKKQGLKNKEVQAQDDAVEQAMVATPPPSQEKKEDDVQYVQAQDDAVEQAMVATPPPSQEKKEDDVQYAQAQDDAVDHAIVVTPPIQKKEKKKKKKKKKKECEVQYGELVFNSPETKEKEMPKVQEESVYSQIQHG